MVVLSKLHCSFYLLLSLGSQSIFRVGPPLSALQPPYRLSQRVVSWAVVKPVRLTVKVNLASSSSGSDCAKGRGARSTAACFTDGKDASQTECQFQSPVCGHSRAVNSFCFFLFMFVWIILYIQKLTHFHLPFVKCNLGRKMLGSGVGKL